jgi:hypothetical protein
MISLALYTRVDGCVVRRAADRVLSSSTMGPLVWRFYGTSGAGRSKHINRLKKLFDALVPLVTPYGKQLTLAGRIGDFARGGEGIQRR